MKPGDLLFNVGILAIVVAIAWLLGPWGLLGAGSLLALLEA